jgi:hypothetical protein
MLKLAHEKSIIAPLKVVVQARVVVRARVVVTAQKRVWKRLATTNLTAAGLITGWVTDQWDTRDFGPGDWVWVQFMGREE